MITAPVAARRAGRRTILVAVIAMVMLGTAGQSGADPDDNPCQMVAGLLCKFMPLAPELDGDIDLTKQQPPADPSVPEPDMRAPADICARGCM